jgi:plastocyanin
MKEMVVLAAVMLLTGFAGAEPGVTIRMTGRDAFVPKTLTIKVGGTVVWENDSAGIHTVTDNPDLAAAKQDAAMPAGATAFNSGTVEPGKQYSQTFTVPGTYKYFCVPHEAGGMVGTIVVTR